MERGAVAAGASTRVSGSSDDGDSDGDWAGPAAGGDAGNLPGDADFGDMAGDADSGALAGQSMPDVVTSATFETVPEQRKNGGASFGGETTLATHVFEDTHLQKLTE